MLLNRLPRLMVAMMFLSIVGLGYTVKMDQASAGVVAESLSGTTF